MDESEILPAPVINVPPRNDDKWERERSAFQRMLPTLLGTSRGKYVAIHEETVVETGDSSVETAQSAYAKCGYIPIFIGFVSDQGPRSIRFLNMYTVDSEAMFGRNGETPADSKRANLAACE